MKPEALDLLQELIREYAYSDNIPAVNRNSERVKKYLEAAGIACTVTDVGGRQVLAASLCPGETPDYLFNAHLDVVPVSDPEQAVPVLKEGRLYGRGSQDCLSAVVCICELLIQLKGQAKIGAFFSMDEEKGGMTAKAMVEKGYRAAKAVIVIDGGFKSITYAQKGIISLKLIANGKGGHSSRPWLFDNPIDRLLDGYLKLRNAWQNPTAMNPWQDSMAATVISGGRVTNQIPDQAEMTLNIRYTDIRDYDKIVRFVREKTGLQVLLDRQSNPVAIPPDHPELLKLKACYERAYPGEEITIGRMFGATDARHFAVLDVPAIAIGLDGHGAHEASEYCVLDSIDTIAAMLADYVTGGK